MTRTVARTFPRTPLELVELMLSEEYQRLRSERLGGLEVPTVERSDGKASVRFRRRLPLDSLPGPLRSLAGSGEVTQIERWEVIAAERCTATWTTEAAMPGTASGTFEVVPAEGGSRYTVVATVDVKVPLIGGRIAKEAEGHVVGLVEAEMDLAEEFLARG